MYSEDVPQKYRQNAINLGNFLENKGYIDQTRKSVKSFANKRQHKKWKKKLKENYIEEARTAGAITISTIIFWFVKFYLMNYLEKLLFSDVR